MDEQISTRRWKPFLWLAGGLAVLAAVVAFLVRWLRQRPAAEERPPALAPETPPGLTEEEAAARWTEGQDNTVQLRPPRTEKQIWRENIYTIFNLNLVGLAFTQSLLGQWLSAFLSLGTIALNVGINVAQEMLARRRLAEFQRSARPKATVVREGKARSIDPNQVVPGDVLLVGPGDQFLVDGEVVGGGQMVVDTSLVEGKGGYQTLQAGDTVYAGSFCLSGRGAYVAHKVGDERFIVSRLADQPAAAEELTPLERLIDRILRFLLILVAVYTVLLLAAYFQLDAGIPVDMFNDAASVIFNVAPASLFLMIVVTYTTGLADLGRLGALVHRARSVESLAEATVICFAEAGILTGTSVDLQPLQKPDDPEHVPESRLRQILGDYARSTSAPNPVTRVLGETFEGSRRAIRDEAPFLTAYGWSAISFDEQDLPGVYVLGEPRLLKGYLGADYEAAEESKSPAPVAAVRRLVSPLGRLFRRRGRHEAEEEGAAEETNPPPLEEGAAVKAHVTKNEGSEGEEKRPPFFRRWARRVTSALRRTTDGPDQAASPQKAGQEEVFLFAYQPQPAPLRDGEGNVQLPEELIPLCELRYTRRLRPEAVDVVNTFDATGVSVKIFAAGDPGALVSLLQQAGLEEEGEQLEEAGWVTGPELEQLSTAEFRRTAARNSLFGHITPVQAGKVVRALRESGESVAVVGDGITDLPALQQANLAIARQMSTQAALSVADIVMMGNSPQALPRVLHKGQRIVHGLLDVLKLNLTQVFYLALLIAALRALGAGFPYASAQGTAINVITVALPSVVLSLWAQPGVVSSGRFGHILSRFVVPAAVTMSLAAAVVYLHFLNQTGQMAYAQLAVTYTLIYCGLLLAVFAKPPAQKRHGVWKADWPMTVLALFLGVAVFFLPALRLAQKFLKLDWLQQPADYALIGLVVLGWAVVVNALWWLFRTLDILEARPKVGTKTKP